MKPPKPLKPFWQSHLDDHVIDLAWSPDGNSLAAASVSGPVFILDAELGTTLHTLTGHDFGTTAVAWGGAKVLATAGQDGLSACYGGLTVWHTESGWAKREFTWKGSVLAVAWSPDGRWFATGE